jgi:protein translocase SecG subunit
MEFAYKLIGFGLIFISIGLVFFILVQKSTESGMFTSSAMAGNSVMSGTEANNFLFKITKYLSVAFFVAILLMAALGMRIGKSQKISEVESQDDTVTSETQQAKIPVQE